MSRAPRITRANVVALANAFRAELRDTLTDRQLREVDARNAQQVTMDTCASHDFCDANDAMATAYQDALHYPFNAMSETAQGLWNKAWDLARTKPFASSERVG